MRIGAFELVEPIPELRDPLVIANLTPWLDAGSVGTLALSRLTEHLRAKNLAELEKPGRFFDFTRYRPTMRYVEGERVLQLPNARLSYAKRLEGSDLLLFNVLEPHMFAEEYMESIIDLMKKLGVKRYCRVGASWGSVPHTRPLRVSYSLSGQPIDLKTGQPLPRRGRYEGPTSIMNQVSDKLEGLGIANVSLMLRLPYYVRLEEDYTGISRLLEDISELFQMGPDLAKIIAADAAEGRGQYREISAEAASNNALQVVLRSLEEEYDDAPSGTADEPPALSPEIERFLNEIDRRMSES